MCNIVLLPFTYRSKGPKGFFDPFEKASDLWSVGCILAEMILGQPILPGSDAMDQANKIMTLNLGEFFPPGSPGTFFGGLELVVLVTCQLFAPAYFSSGRSSGPCQKVLGA